MLLLLLLVSSVTSKVSTSYQEGLTWQSKDMECQNCVTGSRPSCSLDAACEIIDENLLDEVSDVNTEVVCQQLCADTAEDF